MGIALDANGDVYVAETQNDRIQRFSSTGEHKATWETEDHFEDDSISTSNRLTIRGTSVYVTSQFSSKIQEFNRDGQFQRALSDRPGDADGELNDPKGLATDAQGNLIVADWDNNRIQVLTSADAHVRNWGGLPVSSAAGKFDGPGDVAVDSAGNVFVVDWGNNRVQKFTSTGQHLLSWGGAGDGDANLNGPDGIAVDSDDNVYVSDLGHQTIKKFTNNGGFITRIGSAHPDNGGLGYGLKGIAIDARGTVFVVDAEEIKTFKPPSASRRGGVRSRGSAWRRRP